MTTRDAILRDILANPTDDTPRLIYADWLEDHEGEAGALYADFIRVQIGRALLSCEWEAKDGAACPQYNAKRPAYRTQVWCPSCARDQQVQKRERDILEPLWPRLPELIPGWYSIDWGSHPEWEPLVVFADAKRRPLDDAFPPGTQTIHVVYRRGFPHTVNLPLDLWMRHGRAIVVAHPIDRVELTDKRPSPTNPIDFWGWYRWEESSNFDPDDLPPDLWSLVPCVQEDDDENFKWFDSEQDANAALSTACLAFVRRQVTAVT